MPAVTRSGLAPAGSGSPGVTSGSGASGSSRAACLAAAACLLAANAWARRAPEIAKIPMTHTVQPIRNPRDPPAGVFELESFVGMTAGTNLRQTGAKNQSSGGRFGHFLTPVGPVADAGSVGACCLQR